MTAFEKYPFLPGFATEFKDGGLIVRAEETPPGTESVLLLGTAIDGPVGEPVAVDPSTIELIFGGSKTSTGNFNGATLVKGFNEAFEAGCRDIRVMRISGTNAKVDIPVKEQGKSTLEQVDKVLTIPENDLLNTETIHEITFPEGYTYVADSASIAELEAADYTVEEVLTTGLKVTIKAAKHQAKKNVRLNYKLADVDLAEEARYETILLKGTDVIVTLDEKVEDGFYLYHNGRLVNKTKYKLDSAKTKLTVNAGTFAPGSEVEVSYITKRSEDKDYKVAIESAYAGDVYNEGRVELKKDGLVLTVRLHKPEAKKAQMSEASPEFSSTDYPTLGELADAFNAHPNNRAYKMSISEDAKKIATIDLPTTNNEGEFPFASGSDGVDISKYQIFEKLGGQRNEEGMVEQQGMYHVLENYSVDMIVPLGVHADDKLPGKYNNFASQLALACGIISSNGHTTTGVIATSSPSETGLAAVKEHFDKLMKHKNDYFMRDASGYVINDTTTGKPMDLGRFISVVAGPDVILNTDGLRTYSANSASGYAGFVSDLDAQSAPTNKVAEYARGLRFTFSNAQLNALTGARFVTLRYKGSSPNVAVVDGPTAAQPDSDYRRLSTVRVLKTVINEIQIVCDPYIGEPNEVPQRNALSSAIAKKLDILKEIGVLVDYSFVLVSTQSMRALGEAQLELTIVPPLELRKITTIVNMRP